MKPEGRYVCRCECGGNVRGVYQFGQLWTWCDRCTPVVTVNVQALLRPTNEETKR